MLQDSHLDFATILQQIDADVDISPPMSMMPARAALAQLVEHGIRNAGVVSSSLTGGTIFSRSPQKP